MSSATETLRNLLTTKIGGSPFARELRLVAPRDIALVCGCTRRKVEADIFTGKLDSVRVGGRMFACIDAIVEWFERGQQPRQCRTRRTLVSDTNGQRKCCDGCGFEQKSAHSMTTFTEKKGRVPYEHATLTTNLHGQNTTPRNTSNQKISLGKADLRGNRVTARPKTTGRVRQFVMAKPLFTENSLGFFPGNGNVVDRPAGVNPSSRADVPVLALHAMANKWGSTLSHPVGMRAFERAAL